MCVRHYAGCIISALLPDEEGTVLKKEEEVGVNANKVGALRATKVFGFPPSDTQNLGNLCIAYSCLLGLVRAALVCLSVQLVSGEVFFCVLYLFCAVCCCPA